MRRFHLARAAIFASVARFGENVVPLLRFWRGDGLGIWPEANFFSKNRGFRRWSDWGKRSCFHKTGSFRMGLFMFFPVIVSIGLGFSRASFLRRQDGLLPASRPPSEPSFSRRTGWARFLWPAGQASSGRPPPGSIRRCREPKPFPSTSDRWWRNGGFCFPAANG